MGSQNIRPTWWIPFDYKYNVRTSVEGRGVGRAVSMVDCFMEDYILALTVVAVPDFQNLTLRV